MHTADVFGGFGGPGGWDEGARILGLADEMVAVELDEHAARAAVTAGHGRIVADIRDVEPADFPNARGAILSSPCPTWSRAGKHAGAADLDIVLDVITCAGSGCDCTWADRDAHLDEASDPRSALAAQCIRFALDLPALEWIALEQVATDATVMMFEDIAAELLSWDDGDGIDDPDDPDYTGTGGHGPGWESVDVFTVEAAELGMPVRRKRVFLVGQRYTALGANRVNSPAYVKPDTFPARSMARALGWPDGERVNTRGNRRTSGGNYFSADGPAWCLTEKARGWYRESDGLRLTPAEAGLLQGFRRDYPWSGARTRQFHQSADVVLPPVAAAVLGYTLGIPWEDRVRDYQEQLYGPPGGYDANAWGQYELFAA
jgi:DNA (cytosine-5)-methyltransferase 1